MAKSDQKGGSDVDQQVHFLHDTKNGTNFCEDGKERAIRGGEPPNDIVRVSICSDVPQTSLLFDRSAHAGLEV